MKRSILAIVGGLLLTTAAAAHAQNLEAVLNSMDQAAANFHTAQCDFTADQYQKVVDVLDLLRCLELTQVGLVTGKQAS